jgi:hypothetical protein
MDTLDNKIAGDGYFVAFLICYVESNLSFEQGLNRSVSEMQIYIVMKLNKISYRNILTSSGSLGSFSRL